MAPETIPSSPGWGEENSRTFIDYGRYFVPDRERQLETICRLVPPLAHPFNVIDLCCGEGLLAAALLERFPLCTVVGYDGSQEMLRHARQALAAFGDRFQPLHCDLAASSWRTVPWSVQAVVSSLAIHHLDGRQKATLYRDLFALLEPGGVLVIADVILPAHGLGEKLAEVEWDRAVQERALALDGHVGAFDTFQREQWNMYRHFDPDDIDKPSRLLDQLKWLEAAGFANVDVYWMRAGHAVFGGRKLEWDRNLASGEGIETWPRS